MNEQENDHAPTNEVFHCIRVKQIKTDMGYAISLHQTQAHTRTQKHTG